MADFTLVIKAVDQASAALKSVEKSLGALSTKADQVNKAVSNSLSGIKNVADKVSVGFLAMATASSFYAKSVSDASKATDVSIATILGFGQALQENGGLASKAGDAIDKFSENLGSAKQGSFDTQYAFSKLGVTFQDLNNLSNEDIFKKTIEGLGNLTDKAQAAALKQQFFGKTLDGVNIAGAAADIDKYIAAQRGNVAAIESAEQAVGNLKSAYTRLEIAIVKALKPVADFVNKASPAQIDKFIDAIVTLGTAMLALSAGLKIFSIFTTAISAIAGYFVIFKAGASLVATGIGSLATAFGLIKDAVLVLISPFVTLASKLTVLGDVFAMIGRGLLFFLGGLARLIPFVGTVVLIGAAINEAIKLAFDFDPIDWFIKKVDNAYESLKAFFGFASKPTATPTSEAVNKTPPTPTAPTGGSNGAAQNAAVAQLNKNFAQLMDTYTGLGGSLKGVNTDLAKQAMVFEELNSAAERLGVVLEKPAKLIQRDYAINVAKTTEELRRHEIELANDTVTTQKFANELQATNLQIYEQSIRMSDASLMTRKFNLETAQTNQQLRESAMRLADAGVQQDIFNLAVIKNRQEVKQQLITLGLLDEAFATGVISLREYADELGKLDQRLLDSTQIAQQVISQGVDEAASYQTRLGALSAVTKAYEDGKISIEAYTAAFEKLNLTYSATPLPIVLDRAKKTSQQFADNAKNADKLREAVANGTVSWKEYEAAVQAIGQEHFPEYALQLRMLTPMSVEFAKTVQDAALKMSDSFTDSFYTILKEGKFTFSSFKDMVTGILDDIAKLVIRKAFADPIASGIAGIITGMQGAGAASGGGLGGIFSSIGGSLGKLFGGGGGGTGLEGMSPETLALAGLADGGIVTKPTLAMIGEGGGPEAVIPLSQNSGGKYDLGMGNRDSAPVVNFTLNAVDTQTGVEFLLKNKPAIIKVVQDAYDTRGRRGPVNS